MLFYVWLGIFDVRVGFTLVCNTEGHIAMVPACSIDPKSPLFNSAATLESHCLCKSINASSKQKNTIIKLK